MLAQELERLRGRVRELESQSRSLDGPLPPCSTPIPVPASPPESITELRFPDLFDLDEIQAMQDAFASALGVGSIITDTDGRPLTEPSNFCRFCGLVRSTERGRRNCHASDAAIGRLNPLGPNIQPCLSAGLMVGGASIGIDDRHIANWLIGQVRTEELDRASVLDYARDIGVDEAECAVALEQIPLISPERFQAAGQALFLMANMMSQMAFLNARRTRVVGERRRAEAELSRHRGELEETLARRMAQVRESEERFRSLIESAADPVFVHDRQGRLVSVNQRACACLGFSRDELLRMSVAEIFTATDSSAYARGFWTRLTPDTPATVEGVHWCKDGSKYDTEVRLAPVVAEGVQAIMSISRDVTDRKLAEKALRAERDYSADIINGTPAIVCGLAPDGVTCFLNPAGEEITGYRAGELMGHSWWQTLFPGDEAQQVRRLNEALRKGDVRDYELTLTCKDGTQRTVLWSSLSRFDEQGLLIETIGFGKDITQRKQTEEEREHLIGELQTALAEIKTLRGIVPICARCNKIRDDKGFWHRVDVYVADHSEAEFTHGLCKECADTLYGDRKTRR